MGVGPGGAQRYDLLVNDPITTSARSAAITHYSSTNISF